MDGLVTSVSFSCDNVKYFMYDNKFKDTSVTSCKIWMFKCLAFTLCFFLWWDLDILHETDVVHSIIKDSSSQTPIIILTIFLIK